MLNKQPENHYTYQDYVDFDDDIRCEIINDVLYDMSPVQNTSHQRLLSFLHGKMWAFLEDKPCEVFSAPFDVFLFDGEISACNKIVQPDLSVIGDKHKITEKGCEGAPDFIIEIISPSYKLKDYSG